MLDRIVTARIIMVTFKGEYALALFMKLADQFSSWNVDSAEVV